MAETKCMKCKQPIKTGVKILVAGTYGVCSENNPVCLACFKKL